MRVNIGDKKLSICRGMPHLLNCSPPKKVSDAYSHRATRWRRTGMQECPSMPVWPDYVIRHIISKRNVRVVLFDLCTQCKTPWTGSENYALRRRQILSLRSSCYLNSHFLHLDRKCRSPTTNATSNCILHFFSGAMNGVGHSKKSILVSFLLG